MAFLAGIMVAGGPGASTGSAATPAVRSAVVDFSLSKRAKGTLEVQASRRSGRIVVTFRRAIVRVPSFTGDRARFTYRVAALCGGRYGARETAVSPVFRSAAPNWIKSVTLPVRRVSLAAPACGKGKPVGVVVSVSADRVGASRTSLFVAATSIPSLPA